MSTHETNTEFIERIMNFCPHGALIQAFVLEALNRYAEQVADPQVPCPGRTGQKDKQNGQKDAHVSHPP